MGNRASSQTTIQHGDPASFACRIRFYDEPDPRPAVEPELSRSWGELSIWADGENLCRHWVDAAERPAVHWYLLPLLEWLAAQWDPLFHEERPPSPDAEGGGAAALLLDSRVPVGTTAEDAIAWFTRQQSWIERHSIHAAADGGLFPRVFLRRYRGDVEISWDNRALLGAPDDFAFTGSKRGYALADLRSVTNTLYETLTDAVGVLEQTVAASERVAALRHAVAAIHDRTRTKTRVSWLAGLGSAFEDVAAQWTRLTTTARAASGRASRAAVRAAFGVDGGPLAVDGSCRAALLFGSLSPSIAASDVKLITRLLLTSYDPAPSHPELDELSRHEEPWHEDVWQQGYELAEEVHAHLLFDTNAPIDVGNTVRRLRIRRVQIALSDPDVRGLSLASAQHRPTIGVNKEYVGNARTEVLRFTLAHELCHLLFDRRYERDIAMASGPWAPGVLEQRANAFAAMFLMPRALVSQALASVDASPETLLGMRQLAAFMGTSVSATIDHLCNLYRIDPSVRDRLREELGFQHA